MLLSPSIKLSVTHQIFQQYRCSWCSLVQFGVVGVVDVVWCSAVYLVQFGAVGVVWCSWCRM